MEDGKDVEEDDEFAYVHYAEATQKKKVRSDDEGGGAGFRQLQGSTSDAFRGHHCPICLGSILNSAMIESCRHLYCKTCLFEWLKVSDRCPLCKVVVSRVLHDIKSPKDFTMHVHVASNNGRDGGGSNVRGSSPSQPAEAGALAENSPQRSDGSRESGRNGAEFRSLVYRRGLVAEPPEEKARRPKSLNQLRPWIAREVRAAAAGGNGGGGAGGMDTRLVADVVEALLKDNDVDTQDGYCIVKQQLQGFLFENTAPFLHELWCFRWSKARMPAYDRDAVYNPTPPLERWS